jgi:hypothetical protein
MSETGITTRVLAGSNVAKASMPKRPDLDTEQDALSQGVLRESQGYVSLENASVEHVSPGGEAAHGLPKNLETSNLSAPKHAAKPYSPSQKPGRPGRVGTGRRGR